jgi:isopenicillin N synthase-like dioxygenase
MENKRRDIFSFPKLEQYIEQIRHQLFEHGYVIISQIEDFHEIYEKFIQQVKKFSELSIEEQNKSTPINSYELGWDRGIEIFNGFIDIYKGSYYSKFPDSLDNIWIESIPEYKIAWLKLSTCISNVGNALLGVLRWEIPEIQMVTRMLDYKCISDKDNDPNPYWCGEHRDHGLFTGLCPAVYFRESEKIPEPEDAGLHIKGKKINIPANCLAFQVGEVFQLISNDKVTATLHRVHKAKNCQRLAYAMFFSPNDNYIIKSTSESFSDRYTEGITFKEWSTNSFNKYK